MGKSTKEVAADLGKSERQTQRILTRLARLGYVQQVGQRGGWMPSSPPQIDLYDVCGLPKPDQINPVPAPQIDPSAAPPAAAAMKV